MLNSCYFEIFTRIINAIRLSFMVPILLNVKIEHSHELKIARSGNTESYVIVQGKYMCKHTFFNLFFLAFFSSFIGHIYVLLKNITFLSLHFSNYDDADLNQVLYDSLRLAVDITC